MSVESEILCKRINDMRGIRMKIQNKFMIFFVIVLTLVCIITLIIYQNSQQSVKQYDRILQRFLVLNEISQNTAEINQIFQEYLLIEDDDLLVEFEKYKQEIYTSQEQFLKIIAPNDTSLVKNYYHMLSYLIDRMERSLETKKGVEGASYFIYRDEAERVSTWLNETTLRLINSELEEYHELHAENLLQNQRNLSFAIIGAMLLFAFSLLFTYLMSKQILAPIHHLAAQAKELSAGNFSVKDVEITNDEVGVLSHTFNQMKRNVHQLIAEMKQRALLEHQLKEQEIKNIDTTRLLKEMELRSLQNQMNPHFLFNTLNTVSKMAYIEGAQKSSDLIVSISKLLRYNLKPIENEVTLLDEMNHVKEYIDIQKARFSERIKIEIKIETDIADISIPLLTLQPIVENAYIHGLDDVESGGKITIHIYEKGEHVLVKIEDNGVGIKQKTVEELLAIGAAKDGAAPKGHLTGIGLINVKKRILMFYEGDGDLHISSIEGKGTKIYLMLPKYNLLSKGAESIV